MDDRAFGRLLIGLCLVLMLFVALSGCAAAEPVKFSKPSIPDDLKIVCYQGNVAVYSEKAEEAVVSALPCDAKWI